MKNKELFDVANADGDKALQAKLRNNFAEWIEVVRCQGLQILRYFACIAYRTQDVHLYGRYSRPSNAFVTK